MTGTLEHGRSYMRRDGTGPVRVERRDERGTFPFLGDDNRFYTPTGVNFGRGDPDGRNLIPTPIDPNPSDWLPFSQERAALEESGERFDIWLHGQSVRLLGEYWFEDGEMMTNKGGGRQVSMTPTHNLARAYVRRVGKLPDAPPPTPEESAWKAYRAVGDHGPSQPCFMAGVEAGRRIARGEGA